MQHAAPAIGAKPVHCTTQQNCPLSFEQCSDFSCPVGMERGSAKRREHQHLSISRHVVTQTQAAVTVCCNVAERLYCLMPAIYLAFFFPRSAAKSAFSSHRQLPNQLQCMPMKPVCPASIAYRAYAGNVHVQHCLYVTHIKRLSPSCQSYHWHVLFYCHATCSQRIY